MEFSYVLSVYGIFFLWLVVHGLLGSRIDAVLGDKEDSRPVANAAIQLLGPQLVEVVREVDDSADRARVDLAVRGLRDPRINDRKSLGRLRTRRQRRRGRRRRGRLLLGRLLLSLLGLLLGLLLGRLLLIGLLRLGSRLLLLRLGSRDRGGRRLLLTIGLLGLRRRSRRDWIDVLCLERQVEFRAFRLANLGERHRVLVVEGLARGLEDMDAFLHDRRGERLAADLEGLPAVLIGVGESVIHVGSRLDQLRRDDSLGHTALLLFGLLLGSLHDDLGLLLGLGGRRRDDREKLLKGGVLQGLLELLDAGHCLVVCVRFLVAWFNLSYGPSPLQIFF